LLRGRVTAKSGPKFPELPSLGRETAPEKCRLQGKCPQDAIRLAGRAMPPIKKAPAARTGRPAFDL
jgi:hypothetical protein